MLPARPLWLCCVILGSALSLTAPAWADPSVQIHATVSSDLRTIEGTLTWHDLDDAVWIDALADLPIPKSELDFGRTFPNAANQGSVHFERISEDTFHFETFLPERWGETGWTRSRGSFANGAWYPQPLVDGALPSVAWSVELTLPERIFGAVGDTVDTGTLKWSGQGERVSIAVLKHGVITPMSGPTWRVSLLTPYKPRRQLTNNLRRILDLASDDGVYDHGAIVQTPLRRRIARTGNDLAYVSEQAYQVTWLFSQLHHREVLEHLLASFSEEPLELDGGISAVLRADTAMRRWTSGWRMRDRLGLNRLNIAGVFYVYMPELPFKNAIFDLPVPMDNVQDDLLERYAPTPAPAVLAHQIRDSFSVDQSTQIREQTARGVSLTDALAHADIEDHWLSERKVPYPPQDYVLHKNGPEVTITRLAARDAPPETVVLQADHHDIPVHFESGVFEQHITLPEKPALLQLDPDRHVAMTRRLGTRQPSKTAFTVSNLGFGIVKNAYSQRFVDAFFEFMLRTKDDTWNRWRVRASTNERELAKLTFSWTGQAGALTYLAQREHNLTLSADVAYLSRQFADNKGDDVIVGGTARYDYDTRTSSLFPRSGYRAMVEVAGGGTPQDGRTYVRTQGLLVGQFAPLPRLTIATRLTAGWARTTIAQERLAFGGPAGVRAIPDRLFQTDFQGISSVEFRGIPWTGGHLPVAGLAWLTDMQVTLGLDYGFGLNDGVLVQALGGVAGVGLIGNIFGVIPMQVNLLIGLPLWTYHIDLGEKQRPPQVVFQTTVPF